MSYEIPSPTIRTLPTTATTVALAVLLAGCGPEAPPCSDPPRLESVLRMVAQGHDEDLGTYQFKTADLVSLETGTAAVTSYDESIKRRSCEVHLTFTFKPTVLQKMNFYMDWMGNPLGAALKYGIPPELYWNVERSQQYKTDATVIRVVSGDRISDTPLRLPVTYKIVKDEGANTFSTSTSYSTATTTPYLKVASNALAFDEHMRSVLKAHGKAVPSSMQYGQVTQPAVAASAAGGGSPSEREEELKLQRAADMILQGNPGRGADLLQSAPAATGAAPSASPTAPAPASGGGPESLMSLITKYEPCGEEAVCLHTGKGNVVWMQASMMRRMDYALLDKAISSKTPVCLRDLTRTEGKNFAADGLDSAC